MHGPMRCGPAAAAATPRTLGVWLRVKEKMPDACSRRPALRLLAAALFLCASASKKDHESVVSRRAGAGV
jgi:hypothetical protein